MTVRKQTKANLAYLAKLPKMHERDAKPRHQITRERRLWALSAALREIVVSPDACAELKERFDKGWAANPAVAIEWFSLIPLAASIDMRNQFEPVIQDMLADPAKAEHLWPWLMLRLAEITRRSMDSSNATASRLRAAQAQLAGEMLCTLLHADCDYA